ncbi:MAG: hypothetical protein WAL26_18895 [Mycobacterium sp.]
MSGDVSGGVNGRNVDFTIRWDGGGAQGHYTGTINEFDFVKGGTTVDEKNPGSSASWDSTVPFGCVDAPPPVAAPPAEKPPATPGSATRTAFVDGEDVDVYDAPGGDGNVVGILPKDKGVQVNADCKPNDWCLVNGVAVPTGQGWIWGHLRFE